MNWRTTSTFLKALTKNVIPFVASLLTGIGGLALRWVFGPSISLGTWLAVACLCLLISAYKAWEKLYIEQSASRDRQAITPQWRRDEPEAIGNTGYFSTTVRISINVTVSGILFEIGCDPLPETSYLHLIGTTESRDSSIGTGIHVDGTTYVHVLLVKPPMTPEMTLIVDMRGKAPIRVTGVVPRIIPSFRRR